MLKQRFATVAVVAALFLLLLPAHATAQPPARGPGGPGGPGFFQGPGLGFAHGGVLEFLIDRLDLTVEQQDAIAAILEQARDDLQPLAEASAEAHFALFEAVLAEDFDPATVRALTPDLAAAIGDFAVARAGVVQEIYGVLTADQVAELEELRARFAGRHDRLDRGPGRHGRGGRGFAPGGRGGRSPGGGLGLPGRVLRQLDLTESQVADVRAILEDSRAAFEAARDAMRDARHNLGDAIHDTVVDETAVRDAAGAVAAAEVELAVLRGMNVQEIRAILTPEQLALLEDLLDRVRNFVEAFGDAPIGG